MVMVLKLRVASGYSTGALADTQRGPWQILNGGSGRYSGGERAWAAVGGPWGGPGRPGGVPGGVLGGGISGGARFRGGPGGAVLGGSPGGAYMGPYRGHIPLKPCILGVYGGYSPGGAENGRFGGGFRGANSVPTGEVIKYRAKTPLLGPPQGPPLLGGPCRGLVMVAGGVAMVAGGVAMVAGGVAMVAGGVAMVAGGVATMVMTAMRRW